jgi:ERCC4-type nuclease
VEKSTLSTGDYGCRFKDLHEPAIFFERKSIPDLFGTLGAGYKRFKKEILRSKDNKSELIIIIEGTVTDILNGTAYSQQDGLRILRTLLSIWNRYQVACVFTRDRNEMSLFIAEYYLAYARKRDKEAKRGKEQVD